MHDRASRRRWPVSFDDVLAPVTREEFLAESWERRARIVRRDDRSCVEGLFSFRDIDRYLSIAARIPSSYVSLIRAGSPVESAPIASLSSSRLYAAFRSGTTLLLEGADRIWPALGELAGLFRRALSARVRINVYATPPGAQGAHLHPDIQDVFALQLEGSKQWWLSKERVHEAPEHLKHAAWLNDAAMKRLFERDESAVALETNHLEPGDLLYMPRGIVHKAAAPEGGASLHLAITVRPVYWLDVLEAAAEVASTEHPELCRGLPPGFEARAPEALAAALRPKLEAALALLSREDTFTRALEVLQRTHAADAPFPGDDHFASLLAVDRVDASTRVERRRDLHCAVVATPEGAALRSGVVEVKGPPAIREALAFMAREKAFVVSDLPGPLSVESKIVLVKRMIREGFLRVRDVDAGEGS